MEDLAGFRVRWPADEVVQGRMLRDATVLQDSMARLRRLITVQRDRLTERRQALITAAVTGQIDVTTARGVEVL